MYVSNGDVIEDFLPPRLINSVISPEEKPGECILFIQENDIVKAECMVAETSKDEILRKVMDHTNNGWDNNPPKELLPYYQRHFEITIEHDMLLWGDRVIIPDSLREILLLGYLHAEHMGIVRSKQLAR